MSCTPVSRRCPVGRAWLSATLIWSSWWPRPTPSRLLPSWGGGSALTLPFVALRSAGTTVKTLRALFGEARIEDLSTPFFCVSADLTRAEVVVHDTGPLWQAIRASCAVPGLVPPVSSGGDLL